MRVGLVLSSLLIAGAAVAADTSLVVEVAGATKTLTAAQIAALPKEIVRGAAHGDPERAYSGPPLAAVLTLAGAKLDEVRGPALAQYVLVEARDGYRVVLAVAELADDISSHKVILATSVDGKQLDDEQGPFRLVVEGERHPARWVRQVSALRLRAVDK